MVMAHAKDIADPEHEAKRLVAGFWSGRSTLNYSKNIGSMAP